MTSGMRIVVTGASGALGVAFVKLCLQAGHCVAASLEGEDRDKYPEVIHFPLEDLSDEQYARTTLGSAAEQLGGVDAFVHLAGGFAWVPTLTSSVDTWRDMMKVNLETALCSIQAIVPHLSEGGAIVCVGAASAQPAGAGMAAYATSKSGIARLVESLAVELQPQRIRINGVMPGVMDTARNRADMPDADWSQWTTTEAVADAILFLCSDQSRAINGAMLPTTNNL